jgi:hypothetical protein
MAIAVVYRPPGMTAEQYNASWSGSEGLLFHAGVGEGEAFFTLTVWKTREAYDAFAPQFKNSMSGRGFEFGEPSILPVHPLHHAMMLHSL